MLCYALEGSVRKCLHNEPKKTPAGLRAPRVSDSPMSRSPARSVLHDNAPASGELWPTAHPSKHSAGTASIHAEPVPTPVVIVPLEPPSGAVRQMTLILKAHAQMMALGASAAGPTLAEEATGLISSATDDVSGAHLPDPAPFPAPATTRTVRFVTATAGLHERQEQRSSAGMPKPLTRPRQSAAAEESHPSADVPPTAQRARTTTVMLPAAPPATAASSVAPVVQEKAASPRASHAHAPAEGEVTALSSPTKPNLFSGIFDYIGKVGLAMVLRDAFAGPPQTPASAHGPRASSGDGVTSEQVQSSSHLAPDYDAALCFSAGYLDLVSAIALACTKRKVHQVLSAWLRGLRWSRVDPGEPVERLWVAADAALTFERMAELRVGESRLDLRWVRAVGSRNVLDVRGAISSTSSVQVAFAFTTMACRASRLGAVSKVVLRGGCAVELRGRTTLDLSKKGLGDEGACGVAGVLASSCMPHLRELQLSLNKIGDVAMRPLGAAIESGALAPLRVLRLSENRIGPAGARAFAHAIATGQQLPALTTLSLDGNQLGDAGVRSLAVPLGLGALPSLEELGLGRNGIVDIAPLVEAIASGEIPQLQRLLLQHNQLAEGALRDLHDTIGASKPKAGVHDPRSPVKQAGEASVAGAEGIAVRVRGVFQSKEQQPKRYMSKRPTPAPAAALERGLAFDASLSS